MPNLPELLAIALAFAAVTAAPGPANLALAGTAMAAGRGAALRFAAGLGIGLGFWGLVAATGLGALLQAAAGALAALKLLGGAYLLWLAWQSAQSARQAAGPGASPGIATGTATGARRYLRRGLLLNLANPKAVLAWMAALSLGLGPDGGAALLVPALALCILIGFGNYALWAWAFSTGGARAAYAGARRGIEAGMAALFALSGLALIRAALWR